jgi:putative restriction endonuclease
VPNFSLPFYHLKNERGGFWRLHAHRGYENALSNSIGSLGVLTKTVAYAELDAALFALLVDGKHRAELRYAVLTAYFADTKDKYIASRLSENTYLQAIENQVKERPQQYMLEQQDIDEEEVFVRGGTFKKVVPRVYNYTCCVSGLKITALFDAQFVDACHIVPFSKSGNDTVSNGISLSPNLHRAFDRGLFTVDENYRVVVSDVFSETGNADYGLKQFHGKQIVLPEDALFYPDARNFGWHRENVFRA